MNSKSRTIDMCSGPLFINILKFSIPFMLTGLLQLLYNAADVIVVGRYAGQEALAGVGTTSSLTHLILHLFLGLSGGVSVVLGRAIGAKKEKEISEITHTAMALSIIGGAFVSVFGVIFAEPLLNLIDVPANVMPQAKIYMQIMFSGKIFELIYNFGSAILRSKGDTKRPLYIVSISGIINVLLNLFFVIKLGMKADGVGLATIISQAFTAVMIIYFLRKETDHTKLSLRKLKIHKKQFKDIALIGIPSGIQGMIFSFSNVLIQSSVNSFGSAAIAGSAAAANIEGFMYTALNTFFQAAMAFISQNMGAKKYGRINKIVGICLLDVAFIWIIEALISIFAGEALVSIYAPGDFEAIKMGATRLLYVGCLYGLCGFMDVMAGVLRGMGNAFGSMLTSIAGICGIRIVWVLTVFKAVGTFESLFVSYPISWFVTFLFHSALFIFLKRRLTRENELTI